MAAQMLNGMRAEASEEYEPSVDRPAGAFHALPSALTGKALRYFVPSALITLIEDSAPKRTNRSIVAATPEACLLLLRAASRRTSAHTEDAAQAQRMSGLLLDGQPILTVEGLLSLGAQISPSSRQIRSEMAYSGGPTASTARHLYAPHSAIPDLLASLSDSLNNPWANVPSVVTTAITGFFCAHTHPFLDGNGRWSRLVALSSGIARSDYLGTMINVAMQNTCVRPLARKVWETSRTQGLRNYLDASLDFERALLTNPGFCAALRASHSIASAMRHAIPGRRQRHATLHRLHADSSMMFNDFRRTCGLSERAVSGLLQKIASTSEGMIGVDNGTLNLQNLHGTVDDALGKAREIAFGVERVTAAS